MTPAKIKKLEAMQQELLECLSISDFEISQLSRQLPEKQTPEIVIAEIKDLDDQKTLFAFESLFGNTVPIPRIKFPTNIATLKEKALYARDLVNYKFGKDLDKSLLKYPFSVRKGFKIVIDPGFFISGVSRVFIEPKIRH